MPVFAKAKLVIQENCLKSPSITLDYTGPNPQNIYTEVKKLISSILKINENEIEEKEFNWDRSEAQERFRVVFYAVKDFDLNSYLSWTIALEGETRPSKDFGKEGNAKLTLEASLRTEYPQDTFWQRSLIYEFFRTIYHNFFYAEDRKRYKEECTRLTNQFYNQLKEFLNFLVRG